MVKTYTTTQGDTWDNIAFKVYKNEKMMHHLISANSRYNCVVIFSANIKITVPVFDVSIMDTNTNLPSWRRYGS